MKERAYDEDHMAHRKIIITGLPRSGKSTLLHKIVSQIEKEDRRGFLTLEVNAGDERTGFEIITDDGRRQMLASVDITSSYKVSRYHVDLAGFEDIIRPLFAYRRGQLLELISERFQTLVHAYLDSPNTFLATMSAVYDHRLINDIRSRKDVIILDITQENRDQRYSEIRSLLDME